MTDSRQLLADYSRNGSETAFGELVRRYVDLVFSTALRLVGGDTHRAEDVAQTVFMDLARKASKLSTETMLGGWLHRDTCFVAANMMRGERRRQLRERQVAEMNELNNGDTSLAKAVPLVDEAINELADEDRQAILLRFYERMDLRSVGQALGSSENAAQKRVSRALEQLHRMLSRRGVALSAAALGVGLASEGVTAAPAGLAASITGTVLAGAATGLGTTVALSKALLITKGKLAIVAAVLVGTVATPLVVQHEAQLRLRTENQFLRRQLEQLGLLAAENGRLSNAVAHANTGQTLSSEQFHELLRLRGEVGQLRRQTQELAQAKAPAPTRVPEQPAAPREANGKAREGVDVQATVARIDIKYVGPAPAAQETVRTNISIRVGDLFQPSAVDEDVRHLYTTGFFRNIRVADEALPEGRSLTYIVQCKPRLSDIKFTGSAKFNDAQLREQISSKIGEAVDDRSLFEDGQTIRTFYEQAGFSSPSVKYVFDMDEPTGRGTVTFEITESP